MQRDQWNIDGVSCLIQTAEIIAKSIAVEFHNLEQSLPYYSTYEAPKQESKSQLHLPATVPLQVFLQPDLTLFLLIFPKGKRHCAFSLIALVS